MGAKSWHGVDRSKFQWFPMINYEACTSCGLCYLTCGNNVFVWSVDKNLPLVANPGNCVLGCTTCGKICPENAIAFPDYPKNFIGKIIRENKIFTEVRKELDERLNKFPDYIVENHVELDKKDPANNFAIWHGISRKEIDWHPIIDREKCVGCGYCVVTCSEKRNVFGFDLKNKKAVVLYPANCMVGCNNCMVGCLGNAISFPDLSQIKSMVKSLVNSGKIAEELKVKINNAKINQYPLKF